MEGYGQQLCESAAREEVDLRQDVDKGRLKIMEPLLVLAPFIGYLAAYLIDLGKAAYYRIPTEYVTVGIEDALSSGCVLIVLSVVAIVLQKYLVEYAAWKWVRDDSCRWQFRLSNQYGTFTPREGNCAAMRRAFSRRAYVLVTVVAALSIAAVVTATLEMLGVALDCEGHNVAGRDLVFILLLASGFIVLLLASFFLFSSMKGSEIRNQLIPGGFANLKIKHVVVGLAVTVFLGGTCYLSGFITAAISQPYLIDEAHGLVLLDIGVGGREVVENYSEIDETHARLEGTYYLASLPENAPNGTDGEASYRWSNRTMMRSNENQVVFNGGLIRQLLENDAVGEGTTRENEKFGVGTLISIVLSVVFILMMLCQVIPAFVKPSSVSKPENANELGDDYTLESSRETPRMIVVFFWSGAIVFCLEVIRDLIHPLPYGSLAYPFFLVALVVAMALMLASLFLLVAQKTKLGKIIEDRLRA